MITLYKNARVCDARGEYEGHVLTDGGSIIYAGARPPEAAADREVDAASLTLMPALIDMHTHLRDPGFPQKETMETGMRTALSGGYAMLCAMANTKPVISAPEHVIANLEKAEALGLCRLIQAAAAGEELGDESPTDYASLSRVTRMISNDGKTIFSDAFMRKLLLASKEYGFIISTHCQPERKTVERDIALLAQTGGNLHIGHISHRETLGLVRRAKAENLTLTCEVTPHHLIGFDCDYRVNPPLRSKADVEALIEGCRDGSIDCLSTDHAPHTPEDKLAGMAGISNIEYALAVFNRVFYENGIPLTRLSEMASLTPAKRLGENAGLIAPGYRADMILFDPNEEYPLSAEKMLSRSHNTPFNGQPLRGRVHATIIGGETRYVYKQHNG